MAEKQSVRLNLPWTDREGVAHKQGTVIKVEREVANSLVHLGRGVRVGQDSGEKPLTATQKRAADKKAKQEAEASANAEADKPKTEG